MSRPLLSLAIVSDNPTHPYIREILDHAGLIYHLADKDEGPKGMRGAPIWLVLAHGRQPLDEVWAEAIRQHLSGGGGLVLQGTPFGIEDLAGVVLEAGFAQYNPAWLGVAADLGEGYLVPSEHPITAFAPRPLHIYGGSKVRAEPETEVVAAFKDRLGRDTGHPALVAKDRCAESGPFVCCLADIVRSVHLIQHGIPVVRDGIAAPDGSAPLDDDILKAEDGLVLDWEFDRGFDEEAGFSYFDVPVADHLRQILLSGVLWCGVQLKVPLPILGPYPKGVRSVAHLSLDTDLNDPDLARSMLDRLAEHQVHATWCNIAPCYRKEDGIAERLKGEGHEIALHFDAGFEPTGPSKWRLEDFADQFEKVSEAMGVDGFVANKNHYTRWEGCTEFFAWCVQQGIQIDSSKGASKPGTIGFPFGTCHPWFPADRYGNRIDCFELCFLTQDPVVTVPPCVTHKFHEAVAAVGGISHFLFHPAHTEKPGVAAAFADVIREGRERGAEWWMAYQINRWERARRQALSIGVAGKENRTSEGALDWFVLDSEGVCEDWEWLGFRFRRLGKPRS